VKDINGFPPVREGGASENSGLGFIIALNL